MIVVEGVGGPNCLLGVSQNPSGVTTRSIDAPNASIEMTTLVASIERWNDIQHTWRYEVETGDIS